MNKIQPRHDWPFNWKEFHAWKNAALNLRVFNGSVCLFSEDDRYSIYRAINGNLTTSMPK